MAVPAELIEVILERTREHKLPWRELSNTGFIAQIGQNLITIDFLARGRYTLSITDERGTTLERAETDEWNLSRLQEIYEMARRQALQIDDALISLKRKLEEL